MVPRAIRAARQKGRKGKCRVINITNKRGERRRDTAGGLKKKAEMRQVRKEGDKVGEKDGTEEGGIGGDT